MLEAYCRQNNLDYERTLQSIKNTYYNKNKDSIFSKSELNKFWKEPIAWH